MEKIVVEDKEKNQAIKRLTDIIPLEECYYIDKEEEGKLFKNKKIKIIAIKKEEVRDYIKNYLSEIGRLMQIQIYAEIRQEDECINVSIVCDNSPILIGREGKNIDALQLLLRQSLQKQTGIRIKVNIDASDYKLKKQKRLEKEIKRIAEEVLNTKIDVKLDSMNSYDRRIVHSIISNYDNLETVSTGETPNRYVTIKYRESK